MSESDNESVTALTPIDEMMVKIDGIKLKLSDQEYLDIVNNLTDIRKAQEFPSQLQKNQLIALEIFRTITTSLMSWDYANPSQPKLKLRPFEAVNVLVSFINIFENLARMTNDSEPDPINSKLNFILEQLGTNYSTEHYPGVSAYRSPIQTLGYYQLGRVYHLLGEMKL